MKKVLFLSGVMFSASVLGMQSPPDESRGSTSYPKNEINKENIDNYTVDSLSENNSVTSQNSIQKKTSEGYIVFPEEVINTLWEKISKECIILSENESNILRYIINELVKRNENLWDTAVGLYEKLNKNKQKNTSLQKNIDDDKKIINEYLESIVKSKGCINLSKEDSSDLRDFFQIRLKRNKELEGLINGLGKKLEEEKLELLDDNAVSRELILKLCEKLNQKEDKSPIKELINNYSQSIIISEGISEGISKGHIILSEEKSTALWDLTKELQNNNEKSGELIRELHKKLTNNNSEKDSNTLQQKLIDNCTKLNNLIVELDEKLNGKENESFIENFNRREDQSFIEESNSNPSLSTINLKKRIILSPEDHDTLLNLALELLKYNKESWNLIVESYEKLNPSRSTINNDLQNLKKKYHALKCQIEELFVITGKYSPDGLKNYIKQLEEHGEDLRLLHYTTDSNINWAAVDVLINKYTGEFLGVHPILNKHLNTSILLDALKKQEKENDFLKAKIEDLQKEINKQTGKNNSSETENKGIHNNAETLQSENEDLKRKVENLKKRNKDITKKLENIQEEYDTLEKKYFASEKKCADLSEDANYYYNLSTKLTKEIDDLQKSAKKTTEERDRLKEECDKLKDECDKLKDECDRLSQTNSKLSKTVENMRKKNSKLFNDWKEAFQKYFEQIRENGELRSKYDELLVKYWSLEEAIQQRDSNMNRVGLNNKGFNSHFHSISNKNEVFPFNLQEEVENSSFTVVSQQGNTNDKKETPESSTLKNLPHDGNETSKDAVWEISFDNGNNFLNLEEELEKNKEIYSNESSNIIADAAYLKHINEGNQPNDIFSESTQSNISKKNIISGTNGDYSENLDEKFKKNEKNSLTFTPISQHGDTNTENQEPLENFSFNTNEISQEFRKFSLNINNLYDGIDTVKPNNTFQTLFNRTNRLCDEIDDFAEEINPHDKNESSKNYITETSSTNTGNVFFLEKETEVSKKDDSEILSVDTNNISNGIINTNLNSETDRSNIFDNLTFSLPVRQNPHEKNKISEISTDTSNDSENLSVNTNDTNNEISNTNLNSGTDHEKKSSNISNNLTPSLNDWGVFYKENSASTGEDCLKRKRVRCFFIKSNFDGDCFSLLSKDDYITFGSETWWNPIEFKLINDIHGVFSLSRSDFMDRQNFDYTSAFFQIYSREKENSVLFTKKFIYKGECKDSKPHGTGAMLKNTGEVLNGEFENGEYKGESEKSESHGTDEILNEEFENIEYISDDYTSNRE